MRRSMAVVVVCASIAAPALAHGGYRYRDHGQIPPDSREPADPPPPPGAEEVEWRRWWDVESAVRLRADRRLRPNGTDAAIERRAVPALRVLLADDVHASLQAAAALALTRIGDASTDDSRPARIARDRHAHADVRAPALLAFTLLHRDAPEARAVLVETLRAESPDVETSGMRALAAVSLALVSDKKAASGTTSVLLEQIDRADADAQLKSACFAALGLSRDVSASRDLLATVRARVWDSCDAVAALGLIGSPGTSRRREPTAVLDALLRIVDGRSADPGSRVLCAAAAAVGRIGARCPPTLQRRVLESLTDLVERTSVDDARNAAILALARLAPTCDAASRDEIVQTLGRALEGDVDGSKPFAAFALGIAGAACDDESADEPCSSVRATLRRRLTAGGPDRDACVAALGLTRDALASKPLAEILRNASEERRLRDDCALSLSLLGDDSAVDFLISTLRDEASGTADVEGAIAALERIGGGRAVEELTAFAVDEENRRSIAQRVHAVAALGRIGDRNETLSLRIAALADCGASSSAIKDLLSFL